MVWQCGVLLLLTVIGSVCGSFLAPAEVGMMAASAVAVHKQGDHAYLTAQTAILVVDVTDATNPIQVASVACSGGCFYFSTALPQDTWLYVGVSNTGGMEMNVYDISDPTTPTLASSAPLSSLPIGVRKAADTVYFYTVQGIQSFDVTDHSMPTAGQVSGFVTGSTGKIDDMFLANDKAYAVETATGYFTTFDLTSSPQYNTVAEFDTSGEPEHVVVEGNLAFISHRTAQGIEVYDVSGALPVLLGATIDTVGAQGLYLDGITLYVADGHHGMKSFDVQVSAAPVKVASWLPMSGVNISAKAVQVDSGTAYLLSYNGSDPDNMFYVIDVAIPATLIPPTPAPPTPAPPPPPTPTLTPTFAYTPSLTNSMTEQLPLATPTLSLSGAVTMSSSVTSEAAPLATATSALGLPDPPTVTVTRVVPPSPPSITPRTEAMGNTAGGIATVSALAGSNAGVSVARAMNIARGVLCTESDDDPLPLVMHPLGFTVARSNWAGAVVGGSLLCLGLPLLHIVAYAVLKAMYNDKVWAQSALRYPSLVVPFQMLLMPSVVECACHLLMNGAGVTVGYGVMGIVVAAVFIAVVTVFGKADHAKCELMRPPREEGASRVKEYLLGDAAWASVVPGYVEGRGVLFESFEYLPRLRGQYYLVEFGHVVPLSVLAAIPRLGRVGCVFKAGSMAVVMVVQTAVLLAVRCYVARFLHQLTVVTCASLAVSLLCATLGFVAVGDIEGNLWGDGAILFLEISLFLTMVRGVYDIILFFSDLATGYRKYLINLTILDRSVPSAPAPAPASNKTSFWSAKSTCPLLALEAFSPLTPQPEQPLETGSSSSLWM